MLDIREMFITPKNNKKTKCYCSWLLKKKSLSFSRFFEFLECKTFAFCWFIISKPINIRENDQKTRKTRKFLAAKCSAFKVATFLYSTRYSNIQLKCRGFLLACEDLSNRIIVRSRFLTFNISNPLFDYGMSIASHGRFA